VVAAEDPHRGGVSGEAEQMVALIEGEVKPAGDRGEYLLGWIGSSLLLDPAVIVDRHAAQGGDLFAAQASGTPPRPPGQPDVFWLQCLAPRPEKLGELEPVHK
jgi:hypothetical protein